VNPIAGPDRRGSYGITDRMTSRIGPKVDMYALGCLLHAMLTGSPPFRGDTVEALEHAHTTERPERATARALDCPIWLDALVDQLLRKDPVLRPHSMAAVRLAVGEAERAQVQLDRMDMELAERRLHAKLNTGRELKSEGG